MRKYGNMVILIANDNSSCGLTSIFIVYEKIWFNFFWRIFSYIWQYEKTLHYKLLYDRWLLLVQETSLEYCAKQKNMALLNSPFYDLRKRFKIAVFCKLKKIRKRKSEFVTKIVWAFDHWSSRKNWHDTL